MSRKRTNISLNPDVYENAKELGINISQTAEAALQIRIKSAQRGPRADGTPAPLGITLAQMDTATLTATVSNNLDAEEFLHEFEQTCRVDWELAESTTRERMRYAEKLVTHLDDGHPLTATKQDLRDFVEAWNDDNAVKTLRVIYGRFFETDLADSFKAPQSHPTPKRAPDRQELRDVYDTIERESTKTAFLILATSGIRRRELMELTPADFDLDNRAIYPSTSDGQTTKRQWVTFYSEGTQDHLDEVLDIRSMKPDESLFTCYPDTLTDYLRDASDRAGTMKITPQTLRVWFCHRMSELGVADRYIDALCGRASGSILAKHYTDYTPANLQRIYEDAGISVIR